MIKILLFHFHHKKLDLHRLSVLFFSRFSAFRKFLSLFFHLNILYVPTFWVIETLTTICSNLFLNKSLQLRKYNTIQFFLKSLKFGIPMACHVFQEKITWIFFFYRDFFHDHSRITGLQGKGTGISVTPHYHFHPLH